MTPKQCERRGIRRAHFLRSLGFKWEASEFGRFISRKVWYKWTRLSAYELEAMSANEWVYFLGRALQRPAILNLHPDTKALVDGAYCYKVRNSEADRAALAKKLANLHK